MVLLVIAVVTVKSGRTTTREVFAARTGSATWPVAVLRHLAAPFPDGHSVLCALVVRAECTAEAESAGTLSSDQALTVGTLVAVAVRVRAAERRTTCAVDARIPLARLRAATRTTPVCATSTTAACCAGTAFALRIVAVLVGVAHTLDGAALGRGRRRRRVRALFTKGAAEWICTRALATWVTAAVGTFRSVTVRVAVAKTYFMHAHMSARRQVRRLCWFLVLQGRLARADALDAEEPTLTCGTRAPPVATGATLVPDRAVCDSVADTKLAVLRKRYGTS